MPIIFRITDDMFEFAEVCNLMVNPCNLVGASGAGLSLEFRKRMPYFIEPYQQACKTKDLRIGTVIIIENTDDDWDMLCLPTKRHFIDSSEPDDIARGLEALKKLLLQDKYRNSVVGIPMLGTGLGKQDYGIVEPMMMDHLGDLEATIFLSMAPAKTNRRPKYLTIAGPMDYGVTDEQRQAIDWSIDKVLEKWGGSLSDYEGIVSGGYPGVDEYVCGTQYCKAIGVTTPYQDTYVWRKTGQMPIVCKPNVVRNGVGANLHLGNLLCEIGDDIILFKPKGHNNNRLSAMQAWLEVNKQERERSGLIPRRVAVFGEIGTAPMPDDVLVPVSASDVPY